MNVWGLLTRRDNDRDLLASAGRVIHGVDQVKMEAALLAEEQQALQAEVVDVLRLLVERAGEVSPCVDAVLLAAEASLGVQPLAG